MSRFVSAVDQYASEGKKIDKKGRKKNAVSKKGLKETRKEIENLKAALAEAKSTFDKYRKVEEYEKIKRQIEACRTVKTEATRLKDRVDESMTRLRPRDNVDVNLENVREEQIKLADRAEDISVEAQATLTQVYELHEELKASTTRLLEGDVNVAEKQYRLAVSIAARHFPWLRELRDLTEARAECKLVDFFTRSNR